MKQEIVVFQNLKAGISLEGTLALPMGDFERVPLVILVAGYGMMDRDTTFKERKPFKKIAEFLAAQGIATFRYDKRGIGFSRGDFTTATTYDFMDDAEAAFEALKEQKNHLFSSFGFAGLSEGGLIATGVASRRVDVDFLILLAPAFLGVKDEYLVDAMDKQLHADGASEHFIRADHDMRMKVHTIIRSEEDPVIAGKMLMTLLQDYFLQQKPEEKKEGNRLFFAITEEKIFQHIGMFNGTWYRAFLSINPLNFLSRITCPVLLLTGEFDCIAPTEHIIRIVQEGLRSSVPLTHIELLKHNHAFVEVKTASFAEYPLLKDDISDETLVSISKWLHKKSIDWR